MIDNDFSNEGQENIGLEYNNKKIDKNVVCFNLNLLHFVYYINNFPKLKNENINRLKYYFNSIVNSNINVDKLEISILQEKEIKFILSKIYYSNENNSSINFSKKIFISIIIVLLSYKIVGNFISKKNIFTKSIEKKIIFFTNKVVYFFNKKIKTVNCNNFSFKEIVDFIENILDNDFFITLKYRQKIRHKYKNFVEYRNSINEFSMFSSFDDFEEKYSKNTNNYDYEKYFFNECSSFLHEFYKINLK